MMAERLLQKSRRWSRAGNIVWCYCFQRSRADCRGARKARVGGKERKDSPDTSNQSFLLCV